jgi:hypothetical protein
MVLVGLSGLSRKSFLDVFPGLEGDPEEQHSEKPEYYIDVLVSYQVIATPSDFELILACVGSV